MVTHSERKLVVNTNTECHCVFTVAECSGSLTHCIPQIEIDYDFSVLPIERLNDSQSICSGNIHSDPFPLESEWN